MPLNKQWQVEATVFASSGLAPLKAQPRGHLMPPRPPRGPALSPVSPGNPLALVRPSFPPPAQNRLLQRPQSPAIVLGLLPSTSLLCIFLSSLNISTVLNLNLRCRPGVDTAGKCQHAFSTVFQNQTLKLTYSQPYEAPCAGWWCPNFGLHEGDEAWGWVFGRSSGILSPERSDALQAFLTVATMEGVVWTKLSCKWGLGNDWEWSCPLNEQGTAGGAGGSRLSCWPELWPGAVPEGQP